MPTSQAAVKGGEDQYDPMQPKLDHYTDGEETPELLLLQPVVNFEGMNQERGFQVRYRETNGTVGFGSVGSTSNNSQHRQSIPTSIDNNEEEEE